MIDLQYQLERILEPISGDFFKSIFDYYGMFNCCGYAACIITNVLQRNMEDHQVRVGFGYYGTDTDGSHHFWTEVDELVFVDFTY